MATHGAGRCREGTHRGAFDAGLPDHRRLPLLSGGVVHPPASAGALALHHPESERAGPARLRSRMEHGVPVRAGAASSDTGSGGATYRDCEEAIRAMENGARGLLGPPREGTRAQDGADEPFQGVEAAARGRSGLLQGPETLQEDCGKDDRQAGRGRPVPGRGNPRQPDPHPGDDGAVRGA